MELEKERTNRIIAQQTANQEKLQARASAAESASLRRQLNELAQQMEQEKKKAAAAKQQGQQAAETGTQPSHNTAEVTGCLLDCICSAVDMIDCLLSWVSNQYEKPVLIVAQARIVDKLWSHLLSLRVWLC